MVVREGVQVELLVHELPEDLGDMERELRRYATLREPTLLGEYRRARAAWRENSAKFATNPLLGELGPQIHALRATEESIHARLEAQPAELAQAVVAVAALNRQAGPLLEHAHGIVVTERDAFRIRADALRLRLLLAGVAALAAAGLVLWFGRRITERLWSRFERAVYALGEGRLERPIRLKGPEDMRRVGRRLEWLRCRLLALEEQRTSIFRHVSHALKTPLATLREGTSLLQDEAVGSLTEGQKKIAGIMHGNAMRLQDLIDSLLKLQHAGFVRERLAVSSVRLDQVIQQVLSTHQMATADKRLVATGIQAPIEVDGGKEELLTIIDNLVANAIKYSPPGSTIRIAARSENGQAIVDVSDDGPGVAATDRERIFDPFYRAEAAAGVAGAGLGLAISRQFALAHRGTLDLIESDCGAQFRLTLPRKWADNG
jgi:two-component system sensor histidine kinase GlrK